MNGNTDWPHLLAAVTAERDALNQVIEILTKRFVRDDAGVVDEPRARKTRRTFPRTAKKAAKRKPKRAISTDRAVESAAPASTDAVLARDAAILGALKKGPKAFAALLEAMPSEPGQTAEQRVRACSNGLTRLRLKSQVKASGEGQWELR